ncbi:MAG: hypothetical protein PWP23_1682 [Candidatus Sumerlaeota bacterium]|nr:hypothetical protein [Candidatus Sumerlaeota bacterium]
MKKVLEQVSLVLPLLGTATGVLLVLLFAYWFLLGRHSSLGNERKFPRQLLVLGLSLVGIVLIAAALPVSEGTRNQIIALIGVLISGVIAFSSTTITANMMAGMMLRTTRPFRVGDFIRVDEHFGRVVERGLLDTEIQTEQRELISFPNTFLISHPVSVVRSSGAIVSGTLSLGYEIPHALVEKHLITAAREAGLDEPFVQIVELGNFAITYRVNGLLVEVSSLLSTRSKLNRRILDTLHANGVEIVSPTFMNQRRLDESARFIPPVAREEAAPETTSPEQIVFDKAEQAEKREAARQKVQQELAELESQIKAAGAEEKERMAQLITEKKAQLAEFENGNDVDDTERQKE